MPCKVVAHRQRAVAKAYLLITPELADDLHPSKQGRDGLHELGGTLEGIGQHTLDFDHRLGLPELGQEL